MMLAAPPPRHTLAPMNFRNYQYRVQGQDIPGLEGLRGKDLDYALVEMEQKAVTSIMEQYFKNVPPEDRAEIIAEVSERTNMAAKFWGGVSNITRGVYEGERTARVVRELFPNGDYDFANQDHRIAVGRALVDLKYADNESK